MSTTSEITKYRRPNNLVRRLNLIRNISNWPLYEFGRRIKHMPIPKPKELVFKTRSKRILFRAPLELLSIFREFFVDDSYRIRWLTGLLPESPTLIDVGANVGFFSIAMLSKLDDPHILAFEPFPSNFALLRRNVSENPQLAGKIEIFEKAVVGKSQGPVKLYHDGSRTHTPNPSLLSDFVEGAGLEVEVETVSLGEVYAGLDVDRVDLLKLDCEGAEFDILLDGDPAVMERTDRIVVEIHTNRDDGLGFPNILDCIEGAGFSTTSIQLSEVSYMLWGSKKENFGGEAR